VSDSPKYTTGSQYVSKYAVLQYLQSKACATGENLEHLEGKQQKFTDAEEQSSSSVSASQRLI